MKLKRIMASILAICMVLSTMSFPVFATETDYVAKIGETQYADFAAAMNDANTATGAVDVEIYGEVEFADGMELTGNYTSISFVGKADDAKITINQTAGGDYLEAHGKSVAFTDLTLAKANPAWSGNSGHMGNYFSVQGGTVTYTNCTFPNGACTSGGTATYTGCTFENTSEYGLWVYDDALVTVSGGTINSTKGIKVYSEDETTVTSTLTVENATFTENVTAKPAVAIGYAESITLIGNTYNNTTAVIELDSGSDANCNGIAFVAKDADGNDITSDLTVVDRNNSGAACGVFVTNSNGTAIYTTATIAAQTAQSGDTVTLLYDTEEEVTFAEGVTVDNNNYTAPNIKVEGNASVANAVAKIGDAEYEALEGAFAAAADGETITLLSNATPVLTSQRAITKASTIDLNGNTLNLKEDDLYFGTTTFKNGTIIVDSSVKPSTAVFWMFENQTLTFDNVKVVASGVTGTYLIGLDGNNSDLNIINGSEIFIENDTALDLDVICVNSSSGNDILIENSKINVTNLDGRVLFRGNYTISGTSELYLDGITKAGIRIEAGQTLVINDTASVTITGEPRDGGIHLTDATAVYTKADTATVNATINEPWDGVTISNLAELKLFRDAVNAGDTYAGKTVTMTADIDLAGEEWAPIGTSSNPFNGIFDGNEKTISNLVITGNNSDVGLFGRTNNGEIKNLILENAKVSGYLNVGALAGTPYTSKYTNIILTGHVEINGFSYVGGLGGKNAYANWTDITVDVDADSYVKASSKAYNPDSSYADENGYVAYRTYVGGVVGFMGEGGHKVSNVTSNINVYGDVCDIGGIAGIAHYGNTFENCTATGMVECEDSEETEVGGIAGVWHNEKGTSVIFTNCKYEGSSNVPVVGAAYNAGNTSSENSGTLVIDGAQAWPVVGVAKIDNVTYPTLQAAINAAVDDDTITLVSDIEMTEPALISGKALILDLGEYKIYDKNTSVLTLEEDAWGLIALENSAKLIICGNGTIDCDYTKTGSGWTGMAYCIDVDATSELTINGGCFTNGNGGIQTRGKVAVNNGTFISHNGGTCIMATGTSANVTVNDGIFKDSVGEDDDYTGSGAVWAGFGATVNIKGGTYDFAADPEHDNIVWTLFPAQNAIAGYGSNADMTVTGGTFTNFNPETDVVVDWSATEGFTYGSVVADGYAALADLNGNYIVGVAPTATVNDMGALTVPAGNYKLIDWTTGTEDMPLSFVMQFLADQDEEDMETSPFADWYGDFVITFTGIENDSFVADGCYLAGHYGSYGWVKVPVDGMTIEEGVRYPVMLGVGMGQKYDYICSGVEDFRCALYLPEDILELNPNLKVNLELSVVDNSKGEDAATEAIINNEAVYKVNETFYTADDFKAKVASVTTAEGTVTNYTTLAEALNAVGDGDVVIELLGDATLDYNAREAYGTEGTTNLTINGNGHTLTLNQKDSDWSSVGLANADAKLVLNNMTIEKTGYGDTNGAWNTHAINFTSNVEMNSVTVNNSMSVENGATLNNVTINEANGYYGLWIDGNGQSVSLNGGAINAANGGRGIKIADEYVDTPKQVTLNVTGTTFNTAKKAAVLVSSTAGAKVTANDADITNVAQDTENFVWVDEDWAAYYHSVKTYGEATKNQENEEAFPIKVYKSSSEGTVRAYFKTLDELFVAKSTQIPLSDNYIELRGNVVAENKVNVSYDNNYYYNFGTSVEGGVTMEFKYADNWNMLPHFGVGENVTLNVPYLQVIGGNIEIAGTLNTNYLYLYGTGEGVTITETGIVNANVSEDKTVQVKGGTVLTVNGTLNTGTLNVWTQDVNNSELILSGENAEVNVGHLHAWNGKDGVSAQKVVIENGATLIATNFEADRGSEVTVDAATLTADTLTLGYGDNIGKLVVLNNGVITNGVVLNSTAATLEGPAGINVTTNLEGYKVVYENGVYKIVELVYVATVTDAQGVVTNYTTLAEALAAVTDGATVELLSDITIDEAWDCRYNGAKITASNVTIDGKGHTLTINGVVDDKNWNTVFRFEGDNATVKNLTIDTANATSIQRGISSKYSITVDNCTLIGNGTTAKRGIIFGEGAGDALSSVTATVTNSKFVNWTFGASDNQSGKDAKSVSITGSTFENASVLVSAAEDVIFTGNKITNAYANITSYTAADTVTVIATGNTLEGIDDEISVNPENITADDAFITPVAKIGSKYYESLSKAIKKAAEGGTVTVLKDIALAEGVTVASDDVIILDLNGKTISRDTEATSSTAAITNYGTLTVKDDVGNGKITAFAKNPDTAEIPYYASNTITNCGTLNIEGGTIENSTTDEARAAFPIDNNSTTGNAIVNISGGTITGRGATRQFANSTTYKNEVNITGGEVLGTSYGVWVQNPGSGDPVASLNIIDGNVSKVLLSPSANFEIAISGGEIATVAIWDADATNAERNPSGFVTGGTFTENPGNDFAAEGYEFVQNEDGTYSVQEVVELIKFTSSNTKLGNALSLFFFVLESDITDKGSYAIVTHTYADGRSDVVKKIPYSEWEKVTLSGKQQVRFEFGGIAAKEMADNINVVIYNSNDEVISESRDTSIKDYIERALVGYKDYSEVRTALADMANYGAAAQVEFKYNTDNLVNSQLTEEQKSWATSSVEYNGSYTLGENFKTITLSLESNIVLNFYFKGLTSDSYAMIEYTDHYGIPVSYKVDSSKITYHSGDYGWIIPVESLAVADFEVPVTCTVYNADGRVHGSATCSMATYCKMANNNITNNIVKFASSTHAYLH